MQADRHDYDIALFCIVDSLVSSLLNVFCIHYAITYSYIQELPCAEERNLKMIAFIIETVCECIQVHVATIFGTSFDSPVLSH